ncbi:hypothetical protein SAMD00019534_008530 [Acytostelium subglobosum LB1]|uniref:hypothetical protein n=1 Tax=Acytostelium subglobosum LB1 TaxID=1410327 RepID=UPI000644AAE8|nr:hypothetical protein SAMD00019534_008530 [Acytostelium subglobosum LB1]GAM17678.1 hypothetical protein SAMD00019534_008530 [Acytostelium subglobosum LB1]|eukprot:XP_012758274.1 hypothetical protein SAMD00019534_008530 [Acytostelium subglobosum LB1]
MAVDETTRLIEEGASISIQDGGEPVRFVKPPPTTDDGLFDKVQQLLGLKEKKRTQQQRDQNKEKEFNDKFRELSCMQVDDILLRTGSPACGLTMDEAKERLVKYGRNVITTVKPTPWYKLLFTALTHPFNVVLMIIGIVSVATKDYATFTVVMSMVLLSSGLRFYEEQKSSKAFTHLKSLIKTTVTVLRRTDARQEVGQEMQVDMEEVVPGDIVPLKAGDVLPGDVRILHSNSLFLSQSSLTGEFLPVEKSSHHSVIHTSIFDTPNICLMSTNIVSGSGLGVVFETAQHTYISSISEILTSTKTTNAFDIGVKKVAYLLMGFGVIMVPIVITINGLTTGDWYDSVMFGLSVAIGLTPEMLPMILNANLAKGATDMSKKKTIVKQLHSIQNMGAMDVLCSDKTGTLTEDNVKLREFIAADRMECEEVLKYAYLNSNFQRGLKNVLDESIIEFYHEKYPKESTPATSEYQLQEEFPFDFTRRRVSVILEKEDDHMLTLVCKGAVEEVMSCCSHVATRNHKEKPLTTELRERLLAISNDLNVDGLRVLCVATKPMAPHTGPVQDEEHIYNVKQDEIELTFQGFLAFIDPPKQDCAAAIEQLRVNNVQVKVLTGDNLAVAKKICKDVGIDVSKIISGPELEEASPDEFDQIVEECTLFAKLTPIQKYNVVRALKRHKHTVGFLGDGINDALALREADIGISVDTATNIAKDASDIILLEKSLEVINTAIITGRTTHANTIKYIKMAASSNFGNVFSLLIASAWLPFIPMHPLQLLTQNLLYDFSQIAIPWDNVDQEFLETPHPWSVSGLFKFMVFLGPISSIFDVTTFSYMWWYLGWDSKAYQSLFQTGWYVEGLITQVFIVHNIRTIKLPFIQRWGSWQLVLNTLWVAVLGVSIPYIPKLSQLLGMSSLPDMYYPGLAISFFGYFLLTQIIKKIYIRVFKEWL